MLFIMHKKENNYQGIFKEVIMGNTSELTKSALMVKAEKT